MRDECESAFRRGYHHAVENILSFLERGGSVEAIHDLESRVMEWRNDTVGNLPFDPPVPKTFTTTH